MLDSLFFDSRCPRFTAIRCDDRVIPFSDGGAELDAGEAEVHEQAILLVQLNSLFEGDLLGNLLRHFGVLAIEVGVVSADSVGHGDGQFGIGAGDEDEGICFALVDILCLGGHAFGKFLEVRDSFCFSRRCRILKRSGFSNFGGEYASLVCCRRCLRSDFVRDSGSACSHAFAARETPFTRCEVECSLIGLQIVSHIAIFSRILAFVRDQASADNLHILHRHLREVGSLRFVGVSTPARV